MFNCLLFSESDTPLDSSKVGKKLRTNNMNSNNPKYKDKLEQTLELRIYKGIL